MQVQFLSDEWASELTQRLNADADFVKGVASTAATVQQVVSTSDGERRYWIRIEDGEISMGPGDAPSPDATITQDYDTAVKMARGEANPVSLFMTGKLRISGNMMMLMQLQGALAELPRVMQEMDVDY